MITEMGDHPLLGIGHSRHPRNVKVYCCSAGFGGEERPLDGAVGPSPPEHPEFKVVTPDNSEVDGSLNGPWTPIFRPSG